MTKRILALVLSLCVIFSFAVIANAASLSVDSDIDINLTICPGEYINEETIASPEYSGAVYAKGWEIKMAGSEEWVPYYNTALDDEYNGSTIRFFIATVDGTYEYSNECALTVKHNPEGAYKWDGSTHWRECVDCGEICVEEYHSFFEKPDTNDVTTCSVCGAEKTAQWRGLAAFWTWLMNLITSLIG